MKNKTHFWLVMFQVFSASLIVGMFLFDLTINENGWHEPFEMKIVAHEDNTISIYYWYPYADWNRTKSYKTNDLNQIRATIKAWYHNDRSITFIDEREDPPRKEKWQWFLVLDRELLQP